MVAPALTSTTWLSMVKVILLIHRNSFPYSLRCLRNSMYRALACTDAASYALLRINLVGLLLLAADGIHRAEPSAQAAADAGMLVNDIWSPHASTHVSWAALIIDVSFVLITEIT